MNEIPKKEQIQFFFFKQYIMNPNYKQIRIIETTKGQLITETDLKNIKYIFIHEILTPKIYPHPHNKPINLEHYNYHLNNPLSLQNTSLTPGLIDHELQSLIQNNNLLHQQIIIMDGSNYQSKGAQLFDKYIIVKGYTYRIQLNTSQLVLLSYQHILKQVQYEFKLGNGKFKPGFIGQILLNQSLKDHPYHNAFNAYLTFSQKTNCPIILNCLQLGQTAEFIISKSKNNTTIDQSTVLKLEQTLNKLLILLDQIKLNKSIKIVIFNIPLLFSYQINSNSFTQQIKCQFHQKIINIFQKHQVTVGFDILRYGRSKQAVNYIALLCNKYPNKIVISNGMRYKTDLSVFGGDGFLFNTYNSHSSQLFHQFANRIGDASIFSQITFKNQIDLLVWKSKIEEIEIQVTWQCNKCGIAQSQKIQKFRKFGKQFCSIKCLKAFSP